MSIKKRNKRIKKTSNNTLVNLPETAVTITQLVPVADSRTTLSSHAKNIGNRLITK